MSNSNSSREVTEKKKKEVWEEAGEEFYQESYPSGNGQPDDTAGMSRAGRSSIPLPSQTARKNSFGYHRRRSTFGRTATVTTNTNAYTTYNSTTRLGANHEVHVSVLPDLADMTIPNERKRWNELHRIKSMPINMSAKRELKAQLTTIPMLKLKGMKRFKWNFQRLKESLILRWRHRCRMNLFWGNSLREIENYSGTCIMDVFNSIKWTVYFNIFLFLLLNCFIILPYMLLEVVQVTPKKHTCPDNFSSNALLQVGVTWAQEERDWKLQMADCCSEEYQKDQSEEDNHENRWIALLNALNISVDGFGKFPVSLTFGFYQGNKLKLPEGLGGQYDLSVAYILIPIFIFVFMIFTMIWQIRAAIKEIALAREGEFYKFSNLIFAGWDHYTLSSAGAKFRKGILKNEMKISLETEKNKVSAESRREKWNVFAKRVFANFLVLIMLVSITGTNFLFVDYSLQNNICASTNCTDEPDLENTKRQNLTTKYLPAIGIALSNFIFMFFLQQICRLENHSHETENTILLLRALAGRFVGVGAVAAKYYFVFYCPKLPRSCTFCSIDSEGQKDPCWESAFGIQLFMILSLDLIFQILLTLVFGYGRYLFGKILPCKGVSKQRFYLTKHTLDIIYIQALSGFFYFSPFLSLFILLYSFFIFYLKKFTLMVLAQEIPETVRTRRTKAIHVSAKLVAFLTVAVTQGVVLFKMEPSRGCGPFRTNKCPWEVMTDLDHRTATDAISLLTSTRVLIPLLILISAVSYFYYSSAKVNRRMVGTLKHMLVLEGHDKQYLFARLNTVPEAPEGSTLLDRSVVNLMETNTPGSAN